jgi:CO/xanthine dehydrogenase Mo-binding subunit
MPDGATCRDTELTPRVEGVAKVTGRARYSSDVHLAGQLEAGILRADNPHAAIRSVDVERARSMPGVQLVLTAVDVADMRWYEEEAPLLAGVARFVGDELAVVVADSYATVEQALSAIHVDSEIRPHVTDFEAAVSDGAVVVHDGFESNVIDEPERYTRGDVDAAFAAADTVVEATYTTPAQIHHALESHAAVADWDGRVLTAYVSTQSVHDVRDELAEALGLPVGRVRVITEHMGGGFGAKQVVWKPTVLCALASMRTGRPVRMVLDRRSEALSVGHRNPTRQWVRLAADSDGRLVAIDAELLAGAGAYTVGGESLSVDGPYKYLYRCRNVRTSKTVVRTHHGPSVAFRAPGYVEGVFALESAMDELAAALHLDPVELRRRNLIDTDQVDDKPLSSPTALATCIDRATNAFGWDDWPPAPADQPDRIRRGRGFACHDWVGGKPHPPAYVRVTFAHDGSVQVISGSQDIGTGTRTILAQMAANELGVECDRIVVSLGDTAHGLYAPVSSGSATVPTLVPAVREAASNARHALLRAAAEHLDVDIDDLAWTGDEFRCETARATLTDVLAASPAQISGSGSLEAVDADVSIRTFGAICAEVEIDMEAGAVEVVRVVCAPDCGRILNRLLAESQVIGGVTQGLGFALTEHEVIDHHLGIVLNANLEDYLVPTIADRCEIIHAEVDLADDAVGPTGAKGLGELPMIAVAPAIANAVHDATGLRLRHLPISRRRLLDLFASGAAR